MKYLLDTADIHFLNRMYYHRFAHTKLNIVYSFLCLEMSHFNKHSACLKFVNVFSKIKFI